MHVNLIPMNPVAGSELTRATRQRISVFAKKLRESGVEVSERVERGADIDAACGQLKRGA